MVDSFYAKQDQPTKNTTVLLTLHQQITWKHLETIALRYRHSVRKLGQQMSMGTHPRINLNMWIQRIFVCPQKWTGGLLASSETYQTAHFKVENSNGCAGYWTLHRWGTCSQIQLVNQRGLVIAQHQDHYLIHLLRVERTRWSLDGQKWPDPARFASAKRRSACIHLSNHQCSASCEPDGDRVPC